MKAMIIGLGPEYNYPGKASEWRKFDTRYASNHGASLISRVLARQFDAEYVDDFSNIKKLRRKFDLCIVAFATHITERRDVSMYADIIEKLDMKTVAFSMGVQDYSASVGDVISIHPSIKRLLKLVSERSNVIGVRGHYTASILYKNGFKNVVPIGCPTLFWGLHSDIVINKPAKYDKPLIVFHRTLGAAKPDLFDNVELLGQDFLDEAVFTKNLDNDTELKNYELAQYEIQGGASECLEIIRQRGVFMKDFGSWFNFIADHDFVFGSRLHGCIAALIQGIPAVLLTRDLRTSEIAEMFKIPYVSYDKLGESSIAQLFKEAEYHDFVRTYKLRYINYLSMLDENKVEHKLKTLGRNHDFSYSAYDIRTSIQLLHFQKNTVQNEN